MWPRYPIKPFETAAQRPFVFAVWKDHHKIDRNQWPTGMPNLAVPELDENEWALTGSVET